MSPLETSNDDCNLGEVSGCESALGRACPEHASHGQLVRKTTRRLLLIQRESESTVVRKLLAQQIESEGAELRLQMQPQGMPLTAMQIVGGVLKRGTGHSSPEKLDRGRIR